MSASDEAVVKRFYNQMCNERKNELAPELFTADHEFHDPQIPGIPPGPEAVAGIVSVYQEAVDGHWQIEEIFSTRNRVVVRWTGSGTHIGEVNGIPPTGRPMDRDCLFAHGRLLPRAALHYSQPPVNPACRRPATKYGQRRVRSQIMPVR